MKYKTKALIVVLIMTLAAAGLVLGGCDLDGSDDDAAGVGAGAVPEPVKELAGKVLVLVGLAVDGFEGEAATVVPLEDQSVTLVFTINDDNTVLTVAVTLDGMNPEGELMVNGGFEIILTGDVEERAVTEIALDGELLLTGHPEGYDVAEFDGSLIWDSLTTIGDSGPETPPSEITGTFTVDGTQYSLEAALE